MAGRRIDYLVCDEAQFYTGEQVEQLARVVDELQIDVYTFGILADFRTKLFPGSQRLASSVSAENAAPKDHSFMEGAEKKSDKPSFDVKDNKGRGRTHSFMEEKKSKNASGTMRRTVSGKSSYFASGQKNAGHDKDAAGKGIKFSGLKYADGRLARPQL